ncbi:ABC-type phosphate/phosphonate transport system, periplasmic component [Cenarchaeum symbiosum A]|uniref:ABC-type phosphate/phosphonate transport system, periplasmic component n=1 Tax=Cenarchaeum symbiosum (strain A) TaxID=414004 RepID=A0RX20_CENSY|nr:ABC-type phosphate/phosphonate transport system, periplasmic component [Cenarchaeum symbiosum A]
MKLILIPALVLVIAAVPAAQGEIPPWIKEVAAFWASGEIDDAEFVAAIEYLIDAGVISVGDAEALSADSITIGFIPVEKADELTPKAEALALFLEERMPGIDVEIVVPTSYEAIIEGIRFGHIDAAFMDTGPAWITHSRTGAEVVLAEVVGGKINYQATAWVLADDDSVDTIEDTLGKRVAFTSITGSSGFVRPVGGLVSSGAISIPGDDIVALEMALSDSFEEHTFAGGYKAALELLLGGKVDVAFGSDIAPAKYLDEQDRARVKAAAISGAVPSHAFVVGPDVTESEEKALVSALIELNREEYNHILRDLYGAEALLPTTTAMHVGDFGSNIDRLAGLDALMLDK